jgi:hypothetical protein
MLDTLQRQRLTLAIHDSKGIFLWGTIRQFVTAELSKKNPDLPGLRNDIIGIFTERLDHDLSALAKLREEANA